MAEVAGQTPFNGYEYHVRKRALWTPTGVAFLVASFGVSSFCMLLPPIQSKDAAVLAAVLDWFVHFESRELLAGYSFSDSHVSASFSLIGLVIIGIVILQVAKRDNIAFMEAYPYMDLSFTPDEIRSARRRQRIIVGAGAAVIVAAAATDIALAVQGHAKVGNGIGFCTGAVGAWLVVHGFLGDRVAQGVLYNYEALQRTSLYRIEQYYQGPERSVVLAAKHRSMLTQAWDRVLWVAGALGALALYFIPTLETPWWWVPLAVAGILSLVNVNLAVRWVLAAIRESEDLQSLRDKVIHGRADEGAGGAEEAADRAEEEHAAFETMVDEVAEGVADAEEAPAEAVMATDDEDDPRDDPLNGDRLP